MIPKFHAMNEQPPETLRPIQVVDDSQARTWHMLCHLSCLAGLLLPFGNLIGPLILWQIKKNEIPTVDAHGKASLNFQITITLAAGAFTIAGFVLSIIWIGILLFPVAFAIGILGLVFGVIAAIKANDGVPYRYPFSLELVK